MPPSLHLTLYHTLSILEKQAKFIKYVRLYNLLFIILLKTDIIIGLIFGTDGTEIILYLLRSHIFKTHGPLPGRNLIAGLGLPFLKINVGFSEKWVLFFYID